MRSRVLCEKISAEVAGLPTRLNSAGGRRLRGRDVGFERLCVAQQAAQACAHPRSIAADIDAALEQHFSRTAARESWNATMKAPDLVGSQQFLLAQCCFGVESRPDCT